MVSGSKGVMGVLSFPSVALQLLLETRLGTGLSGWLWLGKALAPTLLSPLQRKR